MGSQAMHRLTLALSLCLLSGCGVSVTLSGLKAGIISEVSTVENGSRVRREEVVGLNVQWLPYFTWYDVRHLFTGEVDCNTDEK